MKKTSGQSLTEYGLAIGLVVIIGIGGLAVLGSQTSDLLGNMIGQKGRGVKNLAAASSITLNSGMPARADSMDLTIPVTTLDGREIQISIKNYPTKMTENDLLTGEDGGTMKRYAILMQQLAQQLFDEKVISEDQFNALRKIADSGLIGNEKVSIAQAVHESMVEKFKEDILNKENFCPPEQYDAQNPNCQKITTPQDLRPWLKVISLANNITSELKTYDNIERKAGKASDLATQFHSFLSQNLTNNELSSSERNPLNTVILDLSIKIGSGLKLPRNKVTHFINELVATPSSQQLDQIIINTEEKHKNDINTLNLKQNSAQMCGLGKGSVDEPKIKCIPSIQ
jgi:hypothetical protein